MTVAARTALPEGWTTRRPTLDDIPEILALVHASDIAAIGEPDFTADEVRERLTDANTDMSVDSWLALDEAGAIVGWTFPSNMTGGDRDFLEVFVHPERGRPAMRPLLALVMNRMTERAALLGHQRYEVRAGAIPAEQHYIDALTEAGFVFHRQHARMRMPLDGVSPTPPEPPAGAIVRPVRGDDEDDMRALHAVIEEAFRDTDHFAVDYPTWREQIANEPSVSYDEWFVAEVDGRVVGSLQSSDSGIDDNEGWVKRLAVLGAYRKRGLGEALLRRAFAVYAAKGRSHAGLGVDLANPTEAVRLYLAVGLTPLYRANIYRTYVTAGVRSPA
ncbi:GNAT family N-acetyltransferase [Paractinoplanes globisporus]|uniref:GNAT family N-acetyltransferase n=1 Tax=Paractinoplanes globisporus TaxID=113565 RepID=A0ABW6WR95_9ACTN|nr:GNAT family N-acetyltransferase [Actinoplanes globisporus]